MIVQLAGDAMHRDRLKDYFNEFYSGIISDIAENKFLYLDYIAFIALMICLFIMYCIYNSAFYHADEFVTRPKQYKSISEFFNVNSDEIVPFTILTIFSVGLIFYLFY